MRLARAGAVCVAALLVAPCLAGDDPFPNLILKRDLHTSRASRPPVEGTQARMEAAFGELAVGFDCGTPFLLGLRSGPPSPALDLLSEPPALAEEAIWIGADGRVAVHYTSGRSSADAVPSFDRNRNGVPDYVEAVAAGVSDALAAAERAGFQPRAAAVDVYVANLAGIARGFMVPAPRPAKGVAFLVLDSRLYGDEALLKAVAAHQASHAVLATYDLDEPAWWHEATAAYIETIAERSTLRHADAMNRLLANPEQGILVPNSAALTFGAGGLLWTSYLVESTGGRPDILAQIWEEEAIVEGDNFLEATERGLGMRGRSLASAFADFTTWSLFTGPRDDAQHYSFGPVLDEPLAASPSAAAQSSASPSGRPVAPLGWSLVKLESDGAGGGVIVAFEGAEPGDWQADLLLSTRRRPQSFSRAQLAVGPSGRATLGVPWGDSTEAFLLVRNVRPSGPAAGFSYAVSPAPGYPFEIASLSAEPEAHGEEWSVRVVWETESEDGLHGWDVYRSEGRGHFQRVSEISIPAVGGLDGPVAYQFLDTSAQAGSLYQYYVVGLTNEGLTQRSFAVTTRIPR